MRPTFDWVQGTKFLGVCVLSGSLSACMVSAEPPVVGGYATVYADDVPVNVDVYPHVAFEGGYAYYVNDRWYFRRSGRWLRMREEPPALRGYRTTYLRPASRERRLERR